MLKIIGGRLKQRGLTSPKGDATRPTTSIVRAAVFNIAQGIISEAHCLDLCAGSGAIGIEALSRGAAHSHFIECDSRAYAALRSNIENLDLIRQATLIRSDVLTALPRLNRQFDFIYIDPPYDTLQGAHQLPLHQLLLSLVDSQRLLTDGGMLFVEMRYARTSHAPLTTLQLKESRHYGGSTLQIFSK